MDLNQMNIQSMQVSANALWNKGSSLFKQGNIFTGKVTSYRDGSLEIMPDNRESSIRLAVGEDLLVAANDQVEVKVLSRNSKGMQLTLSVLRESAENLKNKTTEQSIASDKRLNRETVNMEDVINTIRSSENPLKYSNDLTNHVSHAVEQVNTMIDSFSDHDFGSIIKENFDAKKMTVDLLYQVGHSDRMNKKISLSDNSDEGVKISLDEDKVDELIDEYSNQYSFDKVNTDILMESIKALKRSGVNIDYKNLERMISFAGKSESVKEMSDDQLANFLASDKEVTLSELQKSMYSSKYKTLDNQISDEDYESVEENVKDIMDNAFSGDEDIDDFYKLAEKLVKKGIPLDERTLDTIRFLRRSDTIDYLQKAADQIYQQNKPEKMELITAGESAGVISLSDYRDLHALMNRITKEDVEAVVLQGKRVSFRELESQVEALDQSSTGHDSDSANSDERNQAAISLETQALGSESEKQVENLQVIRYQMTFKAALNLSIEGVDLKNVSLDTIRHNLENFELKHADTMVELKDHELTEQEEVLLNVKTHMAIIAGGSTASLAKIGMEEGSYTLESVSAAMKIGADRYDQLRTMPRSDLGDSIETAFRNIKDILEDLGLENTEFNRRSVEILGRNELPMSIENIENVKQVDMLLQDIMTKLMPEHVQKLINMDVDVTKESLEDLVAFVNKEETSVQTDIKEQIAKSIVEMEKNGDLSDEEKNRMIGIYRMIHTIENSKGAAVGYMVSQQISATLENLFDVAKAIGQSTSNRQNMNIKVDDSFGALESLEKSEMTIKEQIRSGYYEKENQLSQTIRDVLNGKVESPILEVQQQVVSQDVKALKESLDKIVKIQKGPLKDGYEIKKELTLGELEGLDAISKNENKLSELIQEIIHSGDEKTLGRISTELDRLLDSPDQEGQEVFEEHMKEILDEAANDRLADMLNKNAMYDEEKPEIHELKKETLNQMSLQKELISQEDYYQIPVMVNGEMQQMNMYYFRKNKMQKTEDEDMSLYFSISTKNIGSANIRVQFEKEQVSVSMFASDPRGTEALKEREESFKQIFSRIGLGTENIKFQSFQMPKPIGKDTGASANNKVKKYAWSRFEQVI